MFILSTKRLQWSHVSIICLRLKTNTFILLSTELVCFQLNLQRFCLDSVPDFTEHFAGADNILGLVVHSLHHVGLHLLLGSLHLLPRLLIVIIVLLNSSRRPTNFLIICILRLVSVHLLLHCPGVRVKIFISYFSIIILHSNFWDIFSLKINKFPFCHKWNLSKRRFKLHLHVFCMFHHRLLLLHPLHVRLHIEAGIETIILLLRCRLFLLFFLGGSFQGSFTFLLDFPCHFLSLFYCLKAFLLLFSPFLLCHRFLELNLKLIRWKTFNFLHFLQQIHSPIRHIFLSIRFTPRTGIFLFFLLLGRSLLLLFMLLILLLLLFLGRRTVGIRRRTSAGG